MEEILINVMNDFGYLGVGLLILLENLFPPIPSEIVLTFGGFMTVGSNITVVGVIIASTIGSVLGAFILYYLGKLLNKDRLIKIVTSKWGKALRIKASDIEKADSWFDTKGNRTVFFCRFIPVVRSLISIPAGMSEMPILKFSIYTFFGSVIWNTVLICVGAYAGDEKDMILGILDKFSYLVVILIVIVGIVLVYLFYKNRLKKRNN